MSDAVLMNWGIEVLRRQHNAPFFLALGCFRPHQPLFAPRKYFDLYPPDSVVLPEVPTEDLDDLGTVGLDFARRALTSGLHSTTVQYGQWRNAVSAYLACVSFVDAQVGRILDALDVSPYANNTAIVFWGDNGWHLGEKEHWGKFTGWTRATRVPLIVVPPKNDAPNGFEPGRVCEQPVSLLDLFPTLTELADLPHKNPLDGESLVPLLTDPETSWRAGTVTAFGRGNHSVRMAGWRYIRYYDGSEELYDTAADPHEWRNLAAHPEYSAVMARAAAHIPPLPEVAHFVRMGNKWKAVLPAGSEDPLLYDLEAEDYVSESNNVASKNPEVIAHIRAYIDEHRLSGKYLTIPDA
jgi:arylsulfatase A-like enzyme